MKRSSFTGLRYAVSGGLWAVGKDTVVDDFVENDM